MELKSYRYRNRTTTAKYKQKVGERLGRTKVVAKVVASTNVKKVKEETTLDFHGKSGLVAQVVPDLP